MTYLLHPCGCVNNLPIYEIHRPQPGQNNFAEFSERCKFALVKNRGKVYKLPSVNFRIRDFTKVDAVKRQILRLYKNDIKKYAGGLTARVSAIYVTIPVIQFLKDPNSLDL